MTIENRKVNQRDRIPVNKENMPYRIAIPLPRTTYELEFRYNEFADMFTVGLYKSGELICTEPLIFGATLFDAVYTADKFPPIRIIPTDNSGTATVCNWNSFGNTIFLEIFNREGGD